MKQIDAAINSLSSTICTNIALYKMAENNKKNQQRFQIADVNITHFHEKP